MKGNFLHWLVLLSCISLFGLTLYRLINTSMTNEEKKNISYGQIIISLFASIYIVYYIVLVFLMSYFSSNLLSNLLLFTSAIFYIVTSPIILTTIQYLFQDKLGNNDKFLSIGILVSSIFSAILPLGVIAPSFLRKKVINRILV